MSGTAGAQGVWNAAVSFANRRAGMICGLWSAVCVGIVWKRVAEQDEAVDDLKTKSILPALTVQGSTIALYPLVTRSGKSPWILAASTTVLATAALAEALVEEYKAH